MPITRRPAEILGTTSTGSINELHEAQFVVILSDQPRSDIEDIAKQAFLHSYTKAATSAGFCKINKIACTGYISILEQVCADGFRAPGNIGISWRVLL